jgi:hypothetical protein
MASENRLKANELVMLVAGLLNLDVEFMARVGNLPVRNLRSWLAGKKENLRPQSIVSLLTLLGLKVDKTISLDPSRVHFWTVHDGMFSRGKKAYRAITALSKLMAGSMITEVVPQKGKGGVFNRQSQFLVMGDGVRVVITLRRGMFKRARINPDVIKGASWRDDNDHHSITTGRVLWTHLTERDLTTHEFDRIFYQKDASTGWGDVSLMAREFGVTPADVSAWMVATHGGAAANEAPVGEEEAGIDIDGGGQLFLLVGGANRRAA